MDDSFFSMPPPEIWRGFAVAGYHIHALHDHAVFFGEDFENLTLYSAVFTGEDDNFVAFFYFTRCLGHPYSTSDAREMIFM
jgi:alpha-acetolactate decarboxylase